jgi:hypothetical protein
MNKKAHYTFEGIKKKLLVLDFWLRLKRYKKKTEFSYITPVSQKKNITSLIQIDLLDF